MLLALWMQQEAQLNIAEPGSGFIVNQQRPLAGTGAMQSAYNHELNSMITSLNDAEREAVGAGTLGGIREGVLSELQAQVGHHSMDYPPTRWP